MLLKLIYEFNEISNKYLMGFVWNLISEFLNSPEGKSNNNTDKRDQRENS
jgi:hypothetical protein